MTNDQTESTAVPLKEHLDAVLAERTRRYDEREAANHRFQIERDRRYTEVAVARAEALKVKEEADKIALGLQRDNQIYKDEKANELREQISSERGLYVTKSELTAAIEKLEATIKPLVQSVSSQQARGAGLLAGWGYLVTGVGLFLTLLTIGGILFAVTR